MENIRCSDDTYGLTSIVEPEEQNLGVFVRQPKLGENVLQAVLSEWYEKNALVSLGFREVMLVEKITQSMSVLPLRVSIRKTTPLKNAW